MVFNSVLGLIAIIILTKSCVKSYEFPSLNLKSMLPNLNTPLIVKPIKTLYQAPLSAVNLLQRANPLSYLVDSKPSEAPKIYNLQKYNSKLLDENPPFTTSSHHVSQNHQQNTSAFFVASDMKPIYNIGKVYRKPKTDIILPSDGKPETTLQLQNNDAIVDHVTQVAEQLERKFYQASFRKLLSISPKERHENGISFAQSGLFLYLGLLALCTESDGETVKEIKHSLGLKTTCAEQVELLKEVLSTLPTSGDFLKFRWSSRLVLGPRVNISEKFLVLIAPALRVQLDKLDTNDSAEGLTKRLNEMVETDSGGAMRDTFEEEELSKGVCAAWLTTVYLRARWRSAPTVLNGSWPFRDGDAAPRTVRMIRINDVMRYAHLDDWDSEAIEIRYAAPDLTLLILIPRGRSLKKLSENISQNNLRHVYEKMRMKRVAVILPIYTLRMTLLLPRKLEMMGISRLVDPDAGASCNSLKLSHAVQRIMFWAEAGRNAFKDDGIEWDEHPELERVMDRPYIFFVQWRNITLLSGNFVL